METCFQYNKYIWMACLVLLCVPKLCLLMGQFSPKIDLIHFANWLGFVAWCAPCNAKKYVWDKTTWGIATLQWVKRTHKRSHCRGSIKLSTNWAKVSSITCKGYMYYHQPDTNCLVLCHAACKLERINFYLHQSVLFEHTNCQEYCYMHAIVAKSPRWLIL